jgi:hypothetical protein
VRDLLKRTEVGSSEPISHRIAASRSWTAVSGVSSPELHSLRFFLLIAGGLTFGWRFRKSVNAAENAIRPIALGRKNWIHIGSEQAGPRVAAIVSVVETWRRLKIPVRDYLGSVLPGLANFPINRIAELTPSAWAVGSN